MAHVWPLGIKPMTLVLVLVSPCSTSWSSSWVTGTLVFRMSLLSVFHQDRIRFITLIMATAAQSVWLPSEFYSFFIEFTMSWHAHFYDESNSRSQSPLSEGRNSISNLHYAQTRRSASYLSRSKLEEHNRRRGFIFLIWIFDGWDYTRKREREKENERKKGPHLIWKDAHPALFYGSCYAHISPQPELIFRHMQGSSYPHPGAAEVPVMYTVMYTALMQTPWTGRPKTGEGDPWGRPAEQGEARLWTTAVRVSASSGRENY